MIINEFRKKIKPYSAITIEGKDFIVKQVVKFRFDDGTYYIKCFLEDGYVFADDEKENIFLLVKEVKTLFCQPFPDQLEFDGKKMQFLFSAHAVAEEIKGEEIFKKGEAEKFWDYKSEDNSYLSLGIKDNGDRLDFYGRIIDNRQVSVHDYRI